MDDLWVVTVDDGSEETAAVESWAPAVEAEWERVGVLAHPKKRVDGGLDEEIEGAVLGSGDH
eukprot:3577145-Lingulodinium_polyedra.AAC.1